MYKLLIVEDEPKLRKGICTCFPWDTLGFKIVAEASNGKFALEYLKNNPVDVIFSDIQMPVMTGLELAKELHMQKSKIKVLFLSGYKEFGFAQKAVSYGVKSYITKPIKYEELIEVFTSLKEELDEELAYSDASEGAASIDEVYEGAGIHDKIILTIKSYVRHNYNTVTLEQMAKLVNMDLFYLSKFFKRKTGLNFSDYVTSCKMEKAAEFLKEVTYKTYEVSSLVGYENPKNFSRSFKKYFGKTPKEYRDTFIINNL